MLKEDEFSPHPSVHQRWCFLADKVGRAPWLLDIPLKNINRWRAAGRLGSFYYLNQWEELILTAQKSSEGLAALVKTMKDDSEETRPLRSCSPFPGVLTKEENRQFTCGSIL